MPKSSAPVMEAEPVMEVIEESAPPMVVEPAPPMVVEPAPVVALSETRDLVGVAVRNGANADQLERIMVIVREERAYEAKRAFDAAMAAFQMECPIVVKSGAAVGRGAEVIYRYAPLEQIIRQVRGLLGKHGFSYSFTTKTEDNQIEVTCKATHASGHSESTSFKVKSNSGTQLMSDAQKAASGLTYAKRYALLNAFGIVTGGADDDNRAEVPENVKAPTAAPADGNATAKGNPLGELKKQLIGLTRHITGCKEGFMPNEDGIAALTDWLVFNGIFGEGDTLKNINQGQLIEAIRVAKEEAPS